MNATRALYSIKEAQQQLGGISRNSIYKLLNEGILASIILGHRRFIPATAILELIQKKASTSERPIDKPARDPISR
jgi:Helix-turn-helix domain